MTYTTTTWTTTAAARIEPDYVAVYRTTSGRESATEASMMLTQVDQQGNRRTVLGVVDTATCEVIPAPDLPGYIKLLDRYVWRSRPHRIELAPMPPLPKSDAARWLESEQS